MAPAIPYWARRHCRYFSLQNVAELDRPSVEQYQGYKNGTEIKQASSGFPMRQGCIGLAGMVEPIHKLNTYPAPLTERVPAGGRNRLRDSAGNLILPSGIGNADA